MSASYQKLATFERQTPFSDLDRSGGTWETLFRAYVSVEPLNGREVLVAQQMDARTSHKIKTHWRDGLLPSDRMKIARNALVDEQNVNDDRNYRIFNIDSVINVGELNRELELMVTEKC